MQEKWLEMATGATDTIKTYLNVIKLIIINDYYVSAAFVQLLLVVIIRNCTIFLTLFSFVAAVLEKMNLRVPDPYMSLRTLMRRIRICSQNSLLTQSSISLHASKVPSFRATLVALPREP